MNHLFSWNRGVAGIVAGFIALGAGCRGPEQEAVGRTSSALSVTLSQVAIGFNSPVSVDYYAPTNKIILSANYPSGLPYNFELVSTSGSRSQYSTIAGLSDEVYIAAARTTANGFTAGELFVGTGTPGVIAKVSADGTVLTSPWATLPGEPGLLRGGLHIDENNNFGGDLLVVTTFGNAWRVNAAGVPTFLATLDEGVLLEGVASIPNDPQYGPWAGKLLTAAESNGNFYTVDAAGNHAVTHINGINQPENLNLIPANQHFYGVDFASKVLWTAGPAQFSSIVGHIAVGEEFPGNLWDVSWNGTQFTASLLASVGQFEGATFAPTELPTVAKCQDVTAEAGATCTATASVDNGSFDPDGDPLVCTQAPPGPYPLGTTSVTLTCDDGHGANGVCTAVVTVVDNSPPTVVCPSAQTLECQHGGAPLTFSAPAADNCSVASVSCTPPPGSTFPVGTTTDTCAAVDGSGNTGACSFAVTVTDTTLPTVTVASTRPSYWPPNHAYAAFHLSDCVTSVTDSCDGTLDIGSHGTITRITSDEPEDSPGSGHTCNDMVITGPSRANLRAEREGGGDGRVYTIYFTVVDNAGNATSSSCKAQVVHDQSRASAVAVDSGCAFCVGTGCGVCPGHDAACTQ